MTEDETVGWHDRLNEREFGQTPGDSEGQGSLGCCHPWGCKKLETLETEQQEQMYNEFLKSNLDALWDFDPPLEPDEEMPFIQ